MQGYEYKVIPAPAQGEKARGVRSTDERMALALTQALNAAGREGWDYVRSESLPTEERSGLTKRRTVYVNLLVFRRALPADSQSPADDAATPGGLFKLVRPLAAPTASTAPPVLLEAPEDNAPPPLGPATGSAPAR